VKLQALHSVLGKLLCAHSKLAARACVHITAAAAAAAAAAVKQTSASVMTHFLGK
jgi:hypothetical protein